MNDENCFLQGIFATHFGIIMPTYKTCDWEWKTYGLNLDVRKFHRLKTETQSNNGLIIYVLVSSVYPKQNENTKILRMIHILAA